jgi:hypothetical protein
MKVTCENTTDPTKEVTVTGNGITLKRNCIASVAYFDLSVIFESYFTDTNFVLDYSADAADPFYKGAAITFAATDETTQTDVAFYLRWGAIQFDTSIANQVFNFPFWSGQPLLLNSPAYSAKQFINATEKTGNQTIPVIKTVDFDYVVNNVIAGDIQTVHYLAQSCPSTGHYLQWIDNRGQVWHYMFYASRTRQNTTEIKSGEMIPYYPLSLTDSEHGRSKLMSKEKQRVFSCFQTVEDSIYSIVETILSSPLVRYYINSKWVGVTVKDTTVTPQKAGYVDIEFSVELPKDFIQIR